MNNYHVNQNGNLTKPAEVDWLKKAEYASAAATQGLSLGFADEIEGVAGGVGYALASLLNPNEKVWTQPAAVMLNIGMNGVRCWMRDEEMLRD